MSKNSVLYGVMVALCSIMFIGCAEKKPDVDSVLMRPLALDKCFFEHTLKPDEAKAKLIESTTNFKAKEAALKEKLKKCSDKDLKIIDEKWACSLSACEATAKHIGDQPGYVTEADQKSKEKKCYELPYNVSTNECSDAAAQL